ncbi:MAG: glycosyltransferase family 61 protein, partial [Oculatellaceae cyanobacterium Prado106]|nr:glycosyltransferase family 61 protein [Oculatellaceae cyanobacterium Prado106]
EILRQSHWDWDAIDWFWINDDHRRFQQQTLQALGIPQDKILSSDRHPNIQAEQLIVPSFPGHLGWLEPWALHFLRQSFLPLGKARAQQAKKPLPRRLYISRDQAHHRRVLNEAAVIAQLEPFGFVPVQLEALDFLDQVALFSQAEVIIAPHGGGLTNTLFCAPGTTVIELVSPQYIRHYYWVISHLLGLNHYYVTSDEFNCFPLRQLMYPSPLTEDIWISPETLSQILQRIDLAD